MAARAYEAGMAFPALTPGKIRLYSMRFCPFAQRDLLILTAKHIDHEVVNIHLERRPEWASEVLQNGTVPVLQQDDKRVSGSMVIAEYLEEAYCTPKLLPSDPYLRALDRSFLEAALPVLQPLLKFYFKCGSDADEDWDAFCEKAYIFEQELGSRKTKYLSGDKPGFVDFVTWPTFAMAQALSTIYQETKMPTDEQRPLFSKWCRNMRQDPVVTSVINEASTLEFVKSARRGARDFNAGL